MRVKLNPKISFGIGLGLLVVIVATRWSREASSDGARVDSSSKIAPGNREVDGAARGSKRRVEDHLGSKEAAVEIRRLCLAQESIGSVESFQYYYDRCRLVKLVERLDLAEVEALLADAELAAAARPKDFGSQAHLVAVLLERRKARLVPGEILSADLLETKRADRHYTAFKYPLLLAAAAQGDPDAAIAFWKSDLSGYEPENPEVPLPKDFFLGGLIEGLAMGNPAKAWEFIESLDPSVGKSEVVANYFSALPAGTDWNAAVNQLETCGPLTKDGELSAAALGLATAWIKDDPEAAIRWVGSTNESLLEKRVDGGLEARAMAYSSAMAPWLHVDPLEAIDFLDRWKPTDVPKLQVLRVLMENTPASIHGHFIELLDTAQERSELVLAVSPPVNQRAYIERLLQLTDLSPGVREELKKIQGSITR